MASPQETTDLRVAHATHEGLSGKHNEDSFGLFAWQVAAGRLLSLGVVADGVGGQTAGEIASRVAVDEIKAYFDRQSQIGDVSLHLAEAVQAANAAVYQAGRDNPEYEGMSTTVAIAAVLDGRLYTAHVGDSRIYLWRAGRLAQLTTDHTWAQEAIEAGLLTRDQAKTHPNRNVIRRHLGVPISVEVDQRIAEGAPGEALRPGDTLLICSDGLTDMVGDEVIGEALDATSDDLAAASRLLVDKANQAGGRDNITVVLMQVPGTPVATEALAPAAESPALSPGPPADARARRRRPWLVVGGILLLLILAGLAVALLARDEAGSIGPATPETTPTGAEASPTAGATTATTTAGAPALIPTLPATFTPTGILGPTATATGAAGVTPLPAATDGPPTTPAPAPS
jgi:protein phosphatase